jgi:hypothetical protein
LCSVYLIGFFRSTTREASCSLEISSDMPSTGNRYTKLRDCHASHVTPAPCR